MKFSKSFERDWYWYLNHKNQFIFDGSEGKNIVYSEKGKTAKECFYIFDSQGKLNICKEPVLLQKIFKCKGAINFMIKEWAQDRAAGYLPKIEFEKIIQEFQLLPWMIEAVENQKFKYYQKHFNNENHT